MASGSTSVPPPPSFSPQEEALMSTYNLTLSEFRNLLSEQNISNKSTQDMLKSVSGLYKTTEYQEEVGASSKAVVSPDKISSLRTSLSNALGSGSTVRQVLGDNIASDFERRGVNPDTPLGPTNSGDILRVFDEHIRDNSSDPNAASYYGWGTAEKIPGKMETKTKTELDQDAVQRLRDKIEKGIATEDEIRSATEQNLMEFLNREPTEYEKQQEEIGLLQNERMLKALKGELPVSEASKQQKLQEFQLLKENAARSGNVIQGDTPETAIGLSTAAKEALGRFNQNWGLREDEEKRGAIAQGSSESLARLGLTSDIANTGYNQNLSLYGNTTPSWQTQLGLLGNASQYGAASTQGYGSLLSGISQGLQPYQNYANLAYSGLLQNSQNASNERAGLYNLLGTGLGVGGGLLLMSSKTFKKNIKKLSAKEEDKALRSLISKSVYRWHYKEESDDAPKRTSLLAEEAPDEITTKDKKLLDVGSYLGVLTSALKALDRKVNDFSKFSGRRLSYAG